MLRDLVNFCLGGTIFLTARSNSSPNSSATSSRAFLMNRLDCSLSSCFGLAMHAHLPSSRSIGQSPANNTTKGAFRAIFVFNNEYRSVAVPEIILRQISVQMFFAAMLIDALHAALEDRDEAFDGVGVSSPRPYSPELW